MPLTHTTTVNTVATLCGIFVFVASLFATYYDLRQNVALLRQETERISKSVDALCSRYDAHDTRLNALDRAMAVFETELEQSESKK